MPSEPGLNPDFSVYYGGTHFNFHSIAFECAPEKFGSEDQVIFIRETYAVTGVLLAFQQQAGAYRQANIHAALDRVREDLMTKGLRFILKIGGVTIIDHGAANDFDGGPTPTSCKVTEITGGLAARIAWTVEIARPFDVENPYFAVGQQAPWHTYVETIQIDDRFLSTRTIRGSSRRPTWMKRGDAQTIENLHPRIPGFKRERKWNSVRDQRQIDYEITDREIYLAFPKPVTNGKATFEIGRKQEGKGSDATWKTIKHLSASYEAPKGVAKRRLAGMLLLLATSRFALVSQIYVVTSFAFSEDIYGGQLSLDIVAEAEKVAQGGFQDEIDKTLGKDVPGAGGDLEDAGPWGTSGVNPFTGGGTGATGVRWTSNGTDSGSNNVNSNAVVGGKKGSKAANPKRFQFEPWMKGGLMVSPAAATGTLFFSPLFGGTVEPVDMKIVRCYETRACLVVLKPKAKGAKSIIDETCEPTVTITEYGAARFMEEVPAPASSPSGMHEEIRRVQPSQPKEDAAGQVICPVSWVRRFIVG